MDIQKIGSQAPSSYTHICAIAVCVMEAPLCVCVCALKTPVNSTIHPCVYIWMRFHDLSHFTNTSPSIRTGAIQTVVALWTQANNMKSGGCNKWHYQLMSSVFAQYTNNPAQDCLIARYIMITNCDHHTYNKIRNIFNSIFELKV